VERAERVVLWRYGEARKVVRVPQRLEVAAQQQQVDGLALAPRVLGDRVVDGREAAVRAALDGDLASAIVNSMELTRMVALGSLAEEVGCDLG
jgi:hypothetical protein